MNEEGLLKFRDYLSDLGGDKCVICGVCCSGFRHLLMLDVERRRIAERYGDRFLSEVDGTPCILDIDGLCSGLDSSDKVNMNLVKLVDHEDSGAKDDPIGAKMSEVRCLLHEERPLLCRIYPYYPFAGKCIVVGAMYDKPAPDVKERLDRCCLDYITTLRYEIVEKSGILQQDLRPTMSGAVIWLGGRRLSHRARAIQFLHPFWSIWTYMRSIELDEDEQMLLKACNGKRSIDELARDTGLERDRVLEMLRDFIVYQLLRESAGLKYGPTNF